MRPEAFEWCPRPFKIPRLSGTIPLNEIALRIMIPSNEMQGRIFRRMSLVNGSVLFLHKAAFATSLIRRQSSVLVYML